MVYDVSSAMIVSTGNFTGNFKLSSQALLIRCNATRYDIIFVPTENKCSDPKDYNTWYSNINLTNTLRGPYIIYPLFVVGPGGAKETVSGAPASAQGLTPGRGTSLTPIQPTAGVVLPIHRYTVIGQNDPTAPKNSLLAHCRPGSNWYGDVVVLKNDNTHRRCISIGQLWTPTEIELVVRLVAEL